MFKTSWYPPAILCAAVLLTSQASAQYLQQGNKLIGSGTVGGDQLEGVSISLSADGNTALMGGPGDAGSTGAAWIFVRTGGVWTQSGGKLVGTGAISAGRQGFDVEISGDGLTAIVGAPLENAGVGSAFIFTKVGGSWIQQGSKLVGTGFTGPANQGTSVAISADGNTVLLGGPYDNSWRGAVWVFQRSGGVWTQQGLKLVGSGSTPNGSWQGMEVDLSADGNTAIVGGHRDSDYVGAAWVFKRSGGTWTQDGGKLIGTGAVGLAHQGTSVAVSGDGSTLLVGAVADNGHLGAAWVYRWSGTAWVQDGGKLVGSTNAGPSVQGSGVSLSYGGDTAISGGCWDNASVGAVWAFTRTGGLWSEYGSKLVGVDYIGQPFQGVSVDLSNDGKTLMFGGHFDNENAAPSGAAWVFTIGKTLTVTQSPHGTISPGTTVVPLGMDQVFSIVPAPDYFIESVYVDSVDHGPVTSYQFTDVQADHSIRAVFAPVDIEEGLVAYYPFDGDAADHSGNGNHAVPDGPVLTANRFDIPARAYHWTAFDHKMRVPDSSAFRITGSLTIAAWALPDSFVQGTAYGQIVFRGDDRIGIDPYFLAITSAGKLRFHVSSGLEDAEFDAPITYGTWQHFAATLDSATGEVRIFLNAVDVHTDTTNVRPFADLDPGESPGIGIGNTQSYDLGTHFHPFAGKLDDVRIYNRALSAIEVDALYHQGDVPLQLEIVATAGPNGTISPGGTVYVDSGETQTFTFFPDPGYGVGTVIVDGSVVPPAPGYTFNDVTDDHTLHVSFARIGGVAGLTVHQGASLKTLRFGVRMGAARGIWGVDPLATSVDSAAGEVEYPPAPPESFDARFGALPGEFSLFGLGSAVDVRPFMDTAQTDSFRVRFSRTPGAGPVVIRWSSAEMVALYAGPVTIGDYPSVNMKATDSLVVADTSLTNLYVIATSPVVPPIYGKGWNLVSLPVVVPDGSVGALFPGVGATPFRFDAISGYQTTTEMVPGRGYWLKLPPGVVTPEYEGASRLADTLDISQGWNLIGSLTLPVPVATINSNPPGIVLSPFYGYQGGYFAATVLEPRLGYWVRSEQAGQLYLAAVGTLTAGNIVIRPTDETPPPPPEAPADATRIVPTEFGLGQNYPNPFNPSTTISFNLPEARFVQLRVFNLIGEEVALLVNERREAGVHTVEWDAGTRASGLYFSVMTAGSFTETKKMVLIR